MMRDLRRGPRETEAEARIEVTRRSIRSTRKRRRNIIVETGVVARILAMREVRLLNMVR